MVWFTLLNLKLFNNTIPLFKKINFLIKLNYSSQLTFSLSVFLHIVDHNTWELHTEQSVSQLLSYDTN